MKKILTTMMAGALIFTSSAFAANLADRNAQNERERSGEAYMIGPSFHLAAGIRNKKAPDLDMYSNPYGGLRLSLFGVNFSESAYVSFLALGLNLQPQGVFVPSLTPFIFNYSMGIGIGIDLFKPRENRDGGPIGVSINLDIPKIAKAASSFMGGAK